MPSPNTIAHALCESAGRAREGVPAVFHKAGWAWGYTREELPDGSVAHTMSARLWPPGRGSTEADWRLLGGVCGAMGVAREALDDMQAQQVADPNAVLKAVWIEPGSSAPATEAEVKCQS